MPLSQQVQWYKNVVRSFTTNGVAETTGIGTIIAMPNMGRMVSFWYDPKLKKKLPLYDTFPLSIPIEHYGDSWLGLNLHYLAPGNREAFFKRLFEIRSSKKLTEQTRLVVTYDLLKGVSRYKDFEICIKKYLFNHVRSPYLEINPLEWKNVVPLPLQKFVKGRPW